MIGYEKTSKKQAPFVHPMKKIRERGNSKQGFCVVVPQTGYAIGDGLAIFWLAPTPFNKVARPYASS
jgi:hypothetical protein